MSVLNRKLGRDLRSSKGTLLAITSIITVGILCFVAMRSLYFDLRGAQLDYYAQCRMADFWIDLKKAPLSELARLDDLPGIANARSRIQFLATVDLAGVRKPLNGLVVSMPYPRKPVINDILMRRGTYFSPTRDDEVIVNDAFARAHGLGPGDSIHLLLNNRRQKLAIVGTAISSEYTYLVSPGAISPDPKHFGVFYLKRHYAEEVFDMDGAANQVVGLFTPEARVRTQGVLDRAERLLESYGVFGTVARKDQTSHMILDSEIQGLGIFATIMPTIFLAVAALVLNVLMTRLAEQQRTVIGTLKAIGYDNREIFMHFVKFGLTVGLLGGVLGCLFGYVMATGMANMYQRFFEFPRLVARVYPSIHLEGIVIGLACALLGSLNGARAALRLQPAEAMRSKPPPQGGRVWLEQFNAFWRRLSFSWRMALRNVVRNRLRTAVGMFAAAMGASLLVVGFMSLDAMEFLVDFQYEKIIRNDIELAFESDRSIDALAETRGLPGVDYAEPVLYVGGTFTHGNHRRRGGITGLVVGARLTVPRDAEGRRLRIPAAGLLMTERTAQLLHVSGGDTITFRPTKGLRHPVQVPIVEITQSYLGTSVYADIGYLSRLVGEEYAISGVQLQIDPNSQVQDALYRELKHLPAIESVNARTDVVSNLKEAVIESQDVFLGIYVLFAGVIFFGSILNASLVSLAERMREIATLRVLGYGEWQIGSLLFRESMLVNLLGTCVGLPLGWMLYWGMAQAYDMDLFRLPIITSPWVWIRTLLLAVAFAVAAQLVVQWRIRRMNWLAALQVKE